MSSGKNYYRKEYRNGLKSGFTVTTRRTEETERVHEKTWEIGLQTATSLGRRPLDIKTASGHVLPITSNKANLSYKKRTDLGLGQVDAKLELENAMYGRKSFFQTAKTISTFNLTGNRISFGNLQENTAHPEKTEKTDPFSKRSNTEAQIFSPLKSAQTDRQMHNLSSSTKCILKLGVPKKSLESAEVMKKE